MAQRYNSWSESFALAENYERRSSQGALSQNAQSSMHIWYVYLSVQSHLLPWNKHVWNVQAWLYSLAWKPWIILLWSWTGNQATRRKGSKSEGRILLQVADPWLVRLAAFKALIAERDCKLRTKSLHAELVFNLSGTKAVCTSNCLHHLTSRLKATSQRKGDISWQYLYSAAKLIPLTISEKYRASRVDILCWKVVS